MHVAWTRRTPRPLVRDAASEPCRRRSRAPRVAGAVASSPCRRRAALPVSALRSRLIGILCHHNRWGELLQGGARALPAGSHIPRSTRGSRASSSRRRGHLHHRRGFALRRCPAVPRHDAAHAVADHHNPQRAEHHETRQFDGRRQRGARTLRRSTRSSPRRGVVGRERGSAVGREPRQLPREGAFAVRARQAQRPPSVRAL